MGAGRSAYHRKAVGSPHSFSTDYENILYGQDFSRGLAKALADNAHSFHHRVWVVDNSGSMQIGDGHRVNKVGDTIAMLPVSRWEELQDTVLYHSQMAALLKSYTRFRLLNYPGLSAGKQEFSVSAPGADVEQDIRGARLIMNRAKPDGVTPLTEHIWVIQQEIRKLLPHLQRTGKRVGLNVEAESQCSDVLVGRFSTTDLSLHVRSR